MKKTDEKWLFTGAAFTILFLACIYKLTNASLWYDETIEYYYSKTLFGMVPGARGMSSMYERIVSTFQPPLYNVVMFFWLKISESEWWFRFFGVVMGVIGGAGIYKSVEKVWNYQAASISVIVLSCTKRYIYYVQECAEYTILLASLCWMMYAWICLMERVTPKRILGFLLTATISVYSQYGAIFPVAAFSITALIYVLYQKSKKEIYYILVGYVIAIITAAIPLWFFFMSKQMQRQQSSTIHAFNVSNGLIKNIYGAVKTVVGWCFNYNAFGFLAIVVIFFLIVLFMSKKIWKKYLFFANLICWFLYYVAVKLSYYSYGNFGNRYSLFFIPIWLVSFFAVLFEVKGIIIGLLEQNEKNKLCKMCLERRTLFSGICLAIAFAFCLTGWETVKLNWEKEDIRGATNAWYNESGYNIPTLIYYASDSGFSYYCEHHDNYDDNKMKNVIFMGWYRDKTVDEYKVYLNDLYNGALPDTLYLIASHIYGKDVENIIQGFTNTGYVAKDIYNQNGGRLIYLMYTGK